MQPNAMMTSAAPEAGPPVGLAPPSGAPAPDNPMMGAAPPQGAPTPTVPPSSEEIMAAHQHIGVIVHGLMELIQRPIGALTKQDVFSSAADMIKDGAFPTPQSKQVLVSEMAKMPDDELGLRKAIGSLLLSAADAQTKMHAMFGSPDGSGGNNG